MKIPKVTEEEPYIEFRYTKRGVLKLSKASSWWGGKNEGFSSSNGSEGNTCEPKDLDAYIKAFNTKKVKRIEKEIISLKKELKLAKAETERRLNER
jgi:hypothetical protein